VIQQVSVGLDLNLPVGTSLARVDCDLTKDSASTTRAWLTAVGWVSVIAIVGVPGVDAHAITGAAAQDCVRQTPTQRSPSQRATLVPQENTHRGNNQPRRPRVTPGLHRMPCAWPATQVATPQQWIDAGKPA